VTAPSPKRAVELIAAGEEERDGESVTLMKDKEDGYDVLDVSPAELGVWFPYRRD
jgi:hypothetical protein